MPGVLAILDTYQARKGHKTNHCLFCGSVNMYLNGVGRLDDESAWTIREPCHTFSGERSLGRMLYFGSYLYRVQGGLSRMR